MIESVFQSAYLCSITGRLVVCIERNIMNTFQYIVESIDGDYAHLRRIDIESDELKLVARALLPAEIVEGSKLLYEWMQYSIME